MRDKLARRAIVFLAFVANLKTDAELQANPSIEDWTGSTDDLILQARLIQKLLKEGSDNEV